MLSGNTMLYKYLLQMPYYLLWDLYKDEYARNPKESLTDKFKNKFSINTNTSYD
jgi:hypothetical protein